MSKITQKKKAKKREAFLKEMRRLHGENYGKAQCDNCRKFFEESEIISGPCPFAKDVFDEIVEKNLCDGCYKETLHDI